jgi:hypothetical protein
MSQRARATRLVTDFLLVMVTLMVVPRADIPETLFDEGTTPINEIVVVKKAFSSREHQLSVTAFVPRIFAQKTPVRKILQVYASQLTDSSTFRELFCSLLC